MDKLTLKGYRIIFKNFRGEKGIYNANGERTFSVVIEDINQAKNLLHDGWALKPLKGEDEEIEAFHLPIKVNFDGRTPPRIYKLSLVSGQRMQLDEQTVGMLDFLPIEFVDVIVNPYIWNVRGETGVKAYCHTMFVVIEENELDLKWANVPVMNSEDPPF